jgi:hypothetical protein
MLDLPVDLQFPLCKACEVKVWHFGKGKGFGQMLLGSKHEFPACFGLN